MSNLEISNIYNRRTLNRETRLITIEVDSGYEVAKSDFLKFMDYFEEGTRPDDPPYLQDENYYTFLQGRLYDCPDILPDKYCEQAGVESGSTYGHAIWYMEYIREKYSF